MLLRIQRHRDVVGEPNPAGITEESPPAVIIVKIGTLVWWINVWRFKRRRLNSMNSALLGLQDASASKRDRIAESPYDESNSSHWIAANPSFFIRSISGAVRLRTREAAVGRRRDNFRRVPSYPCCERSSSTHLRVCFRLTTEEHRGESHAASVILCDPLCSLCSLWLNFLPASSLLKLVEPALHS